MTREAIGAFFKRRNEALDRLDAAALAADYAEDCVVETPWAGTVPGRASNEKLLRTWFEAFPDCQIEHQDVLIDGDREAEVLMLQGTDLGGFMGLEPTGKWFRVPSVFLYALRDGQIV